MTNRYVRTGVFLAPFHMTNENPTLALERFFTQCLFFGEAAREPHPLTQSIDLVHLVMHRARDLHVEAVRTEVDGGESIGKLAIAHVVS